MTKPSPKTRENAAAYGVTQHEIFRLTCAFTAIRDPKTRSNILLTVEEWVVDQWRDP